MITEEQLKLIADKFGQQEVVKGRFHAFDGDNWIDLLTLWSLRRIGDRKIEWLIVLLDWMPDAEAEKIKEGKLTAGDLEKTSATARTGITSRGKRKRKRKRK